jgi:hypothetical protein
LASTSPIDYMFRVDDTSAAARLRYHELVRARTPGERLEMAASLSLSVREMAVAGIRARHPDASERDVQRALAARLYGKEVAERLFGKGTQER